MEKTWRWFGRKDKITLDMLRQIGVEGIVTALYEAPNGAVWSLEAITDLKQYIESFGLRWSVVESLPVSEGIKYGSEDRIQVILDNFINNTFDRCSILIKYHKSPPGPIPADFLNKSISNHYEIIQIQHRSCLIHFSIPDFTGTDIFLRYSPPAETRKSHSIDS